MPKHVKLSLEVASATQRSKQGMRPAQVAQPPRGGVHARPTAFGAADIVAMQRMVGNRAVGRILGRHSSPTAPTATRSIAIQRNGDPYKNEIKKNMTFLKLSDEEPIYRITPLGKVDTIASYSQLMGANGFAFGQKVLYKSKYEGIDGICYENPKDMVVFFYDATTKKMVISEGNHRMYKMHVDNQGSLLGKIIHFSDTLHSELRWAEDKDTKSKDKDDSEDEDGSFCIIS